MADFYTNMVVEPMIPEGLLTEAEQNILAIFHIESVSGPGNTIFLHAEEYFTSAYNDETSEEYDEDFLISLFQGVVRRSEGKLPWVSFEISYHCSKMRSDGFGGAAVFITADKIEWVSTAQWLKDQQVRLDKPAPGPREMTPEEQDTANRLGYMGLVADRKTLQEAMEYASMIVKSLPNKTDQLAVNVAIQVLINTYAKLIAKGELV